MAFFDQRVHRNVPSTYVPCAYIWPHAGPQSKDVRIDRRFRSAPIKYNIIYVIYNFVSETWYVYTCVWAVYTHTTSYNMYRLPSHATQNVYIIHYIKHIFVFDISVLVFGFGIPLCMYCHNMPNVRLTCLGFVTSCNYCDSQYSPALWNN